MVATYYKMPDGKIATQSGVPVTMTQAEFEDCCCGGPAPCDVCQEDQTSTLTLTVSGTCDDQSDCEEAAIVGLPYTSKGTVGESYCYWIWSTAGDNHQGVLLQYYPGTGTWLASAESGLELDITTWARNPITGVTCNGSGQLTGSFQLDGIDNSGMGAWDCSGCTMTITIVPP